jgi:hypothetical protein
MRINLKPGKEPAAKSSPLTPEQVRLRRAEAERIRRDGATWRHCFKGRVAAHRRIEAARREVARDN